mmetsp:Transcript_2461/g.5070  ORF Transcript_2461/g.5070 Transcript_2461/m.5070 type:complete len:988 (-) Transcript_2461:605-3568(-)
MTSSVGTMHGAVGTMAQIRTTKKGSNVRPAKIVPRAHCTGMQSKRFGVALSASTCSFAKGAHLGRADITERRQKGSFSRRGMGVQCAAGPRKISQSEFTEKAWEAIIGAPEIAMQEQHQIVETEHLMLVMMEQRDGLSKRILDRAGADSAGMLEYTKRFLRQQPKVSGDSAQVLGRQLEALVDRARNLRQAWGDEYVSVEHILLAYVDDARFGAGLMRAFSLTQEKLEDSAKAVRGGNKVVDQDPEGKYEALSRYARDLTSEARKGLLDPVIGRDDEIRRCIQILSRRSKNNPVLIGEPGVGKTAISEALAQRIVAGDVPAALMGRRLMALDLGALIAGAKFRGEFEDRLKAVMKEVTDSDGQVVLFIDEIHTVVGAGRTEGAMDAGNLLKPMLARGSLRCIGATTLDEYRKFIEKDPALERRFQQVYVDQPNVEDTISILRGLRERYEVHHGVRIADSALVEAAVLSDRYISERFLPDKAIDLVDEAAAKLKMEITSKPEKLDEIDRQVLKLEMERLSLSRGSATERDRATVERLSKVDAELLTLRRDQAELTSQWEEEKGELTLIQTLKEEVERVGIEVAQAERDYDLNRAAELKYGTLMQLQQRLAGAEAAIKGRHAPGRQSMLREEVTEADISEVISKWTGIPVQALLESEREKLLKLEDVLHGRVIGQSAAVTSVAEAIQRSRAGLSDPDKPIASFMFLGPTGVGKTELAKALASYMFNTEESMVRIDMSEYMEKHTVSRLIGAPPGYVGFEEGGQLTEAVRRRPYAVVLFDEMEKAHADVFNIMLQILDDGRVTDSQGRTIDFKNSILIMTSNVGSQHMFQEGYGEAGDEGRKADVMGAVRGLFRPEFINRVDEFITFDPLSLAQLREIVKLQVERVARRLQPKKMKLVVKEAAIDHIALVGYDPMYGARPVKRAVQSQLETMLAKSILRGEMRDEDIITVDVSPGEPKHLTMSVERKHYDSTQPNIGPIDPSELRATLSS